MIDLAQPEDGSTGTPADKNPRSAHREDGTLPFGTNPAGDRTGRPGSRAGVETETGASGRQSGVEFAVLFERFFDSFRRQVLECYGKRCDEMIARAEEEVAGHSLGFRLRAIHSDNALTVLDLAETMISRASVFKRRRLRRAALGAVSELYNAHYEVLERFGAVERVEQFYYRLKK